MTFEIEMPEEYKEKKLGALEKKLNIKFNDKDLLRSAITRESWKNEHPESPIEHNERLEFLGDSVLRFLISENCYRHSKRTEGEMTKIRTAIEKGTTLAEIARRMGLKDHLLLNVTEQNDTKGERKILADSLEAVLAAVFLDQGLKAARDFVDKKLLNAYLELLITQE